MLFYLSGSIEYSPDQGRTWRSQITPFLHSQRHEVYDPALDERKNLTEEELAHFRSWKTGDFARFQKTMRKIVAWDLDWIERSDALLCYWDEYVQRGAGTQAEVTFAHRNGIPVYLVAALPIENISGWILGCASHVFSGFDEFRAYLQQRGAVQVVPLS